MNIVSGWYFKFMWFIGSPGLLIFILAYAFKDYDTIGNNNDAPDIFPPWSNTIGKKKKNFQKIFIIYILAMIMTFTPFAPIPIYLLYSVITRGREAFYPDEDWGPQVSNTAVPIGSKYFNPRKKIEF